MKALILSFLILTSLSVQSREVINIQNLRVDDTFNIRVTVPIGSSMQSSPWDIEELQKIDVDFKVLSIDKEIIQLSIKPTRWFVYYESPRSKDVVLYFDDQASLFSLFKEGTATASLNTTSGEIKLNFKDSDEEKFSNSTKQNWFIMLIDIPKGLGMTQLDQDLPNLELDFERLVKVSLDKLFSEWRNQPSTNSRMPWLIDSRKDQKRTSEDPTFIQIMSASFALTPNTFISFQADKDIPEDRVFIQIGNKRIRPIKKINNIYEFSFHLSSPKRAYIKDITLDLTPSDSLNVLYNTSTREYVFEGKGAANSAYINSISKLYAKNEKTTKAELDKFLHKGEEYYQEHIDRYSSQMNDYWIKSAKLSYNYWYASEYFKTYNTTVIDNWGKMYPSDKEIPWNNEHIKNLFPFADYLYQPYTYGSLVENFYNYKARQANNSIMTGFKFLQEGVSSYYFADAIFWGYPKIYLTSKTLKFLMTNFHLEENNREYEDFISKNQEPEIRNEVVGLHQQLMKIEPGANIKGIQLDVEKYIPLKNNADKYIILLVGDDKIGFNPNLNDYETNVREIYDSVKSEIKKKGLVDKVDLCIITSNPNKSILDNLGDNNNEIYFVPEKDLRDYTDKVLSTERNFIVMRSDGHIISRTHPSAYNSSAIFLIRAIEEDIIKQNNKDSASSGVLPTVIAVLLSVVITFFLVRYFVKRREITKRRIQELELKAIRAQMNPHFTFNALGSIQNLISQQKDKEANEYLVNFAKLLRMVLSTSEKKLVPLSEEIHLLELYLHLEQLRLPFNYYINIDPDIDLANEEIPGMLIQPIVENAVKHGIAPTGRGEVILNFKMQGKILLVEVLDTGSGFVDLTLESKTGFGIKAVRERLSLLNKELHLNISLKTENRINDGNVQGAKVILYIPT